MTRALVFDSGVGGLTIAAELRKAAPDWTVDYAADSGFFPYGVKTDEELRARLPDLAVIDVGLREEPEGGFELCRELRSMSAELPIIFLTARDSELDAVSGLRLGADDYLTKDLSLTHLIARVTALFRRIDALTQPSNRDQVISRGALMIDAARLHATIRHAGELVEKRGLAEELYQLPLVPKILRNFHHQ